jgi:hypothetical protein
MDCVPNTLALTVIRYNSPILAMGKTTSMRALAAVAPRRRHGQILVLAPTGKAVDVAVREGVGDAGYTIAKALHSLQNGRLKLGHLDLVIVDEAGMAGTDNLRQLLTATTTAKAKTVLVGDAHELAPVKARGGMFAQLCTDLPWTQRLSEVWRMHDPDERSAALALRDGGPAPVGRAIEWYQKHDRLRTGDQIAMATDALAAYRTDTAASKDSLLLCDTTEMADVLNSRIHTDTIEPKAPTIGVAHGHRVAVGDLIISRRNDPTIPVLDAARNVPATDPVRNGNRWRLRFGAFHVHHLPVLQGSQGIGRCAVGVCADTPVIDTGDGVYRTGSAAIVCTCENIADTVTRRDALGDGDPLSFVPSGTISPSAVAGYR